MLTVFIDFKSPASYLALRPTLDLHRATGAEIQWRPFVSAERPAPTQVDNESVSTSHRRVRAQSRRRLLAHYAQVQGIEMHWPTEDIAADCALGALAAAGGNTASYVLAAFQAYWVENADLNDPQVVKTLIEEVGLQTDEVGTWQQALSSAQTAAEEIGIVDAPAYLVEDQIFVGREHLPWIRELVASGSSIRNPE